MTKSERGGDAYAMAAGSKTGILDYVLVSAIALGVVAMVLGNAVMIWHRNYRPIKTKNVPLTLSSSLGGLIWIISTIVVNNHFPRPPRFGLNICILWTFWLQFCFGFSLWLNCLTFHLFILFRIVIRRSPLRSSHYLVLFALLLPTIAISIASSVKHKKIMEFHDKCQFKEPIYWPYVLVVFMCINFLFFIGLAFRLRNAMAPFNEFRLIRRGGIISLFMFLLSLVTLRSGAYDSSVGRCFVSGAVASVVFYYFWARNGVVIYNVLFNHNGYLEKFNANFRRLSTEHERATSVCDLQIQWKDVTEEAQQCLDMIRRLEDEVKALEMECNKLEQQGKIK